MNKMAVSEECKEIDGGLLFIFMVKKEACGPMII
jgi:hypothetical protein